MDRTGVSRARFYLLGHREGDKICGALGLVLPWATDVAPALTSAAAIGLGVIMILAAVVHTRLREPRNVAVNLVLLALCVFVAVGRS